MYFDMATFTDSYPRHMRLLLLWANKQYDYDFARARVLVVPKYHAPLMYCHIPDNVLTVVSCIVYSISMVLTVRTIIIAKINLSISTTYIVTITIFFLSLFILFFFFSTHLLPPPHI